MLSKNDTELKVSCAVVYPTLYDPLGVLVVDWGRGGGYYLMLMEAKVKHPLGSMQEL